MIGKVTFSDVRFSNFPIFQFYNLFNFSIFQFSAISYRKKSAYMGRKYKNIFYLFFSQKCVYLFSFDFLKINDFAQNDAFSMYLF